MTTGVADHDGLWRAGAENGGFPSFLQIRSADGRILQAVSLDDEAPLNGRLPVAVTPGSGKPDGEVFTTVESDRVGNDGPPWRAFDWRLRASRLPDGGSWSSGCAPAGLTR